MACGARWGRVCLSEKLKTIRVALCGFAAFVSLCVPFVARAQDPPQGGGPSGGVFRGLAIDPHHPDTVYTGTGNSVLKSTNFGNNWTALTPLAGACSVDDLVVDPSNSSTLYAVDGCGGVYKSTDGGQTWNNVGNASTGVTSQVFDLVIDPSNPQTLYVAGSSGIVFKTADGGATWNAASSGITGRPGSNRGMAVDSTGAVYYASFTNGIFKTINGGLTWSNVGTASTGLSNLQAWSVALDPTNNSVVYAGTLNAISKSTDGGASWTGTTPTGLTAGNAIGSIAIDPLHPSTIYAGGELSLGVFKSIDGGTSWTLESSGFPFDIPRNDIPAVAVSPSYSKIVLAATHADMFRSIDGGINWKAVTGINAGSIGSLAVDPTNSNTVYAGNLGGSGAFKSTDGGASWFLINSGLPFEAANSFAIDPAKSAIVYTGDGPRVRVTTNGGGSWINTGPMPNGITVNSVVLNPAAPATVYAGTTAGICSTMNAGAGGTTWTCTNVTGGVLSLVINPATPTTLYAGTGGSGVLKTTDGGHTWTILMSGPLLASAAYVSALAIDPNSPNTVYAIASDTSKLPPFGSLFMTTDGGTTWTNVSLPTAAISALAIGPDSAVYAGSTTGQLVKIVSGTASLVPNSGLPGLDMLTLTVDPESASTVYASMLSGGVFKSTDGGNTFLPVGFTLAAPCAADVSSSVSIVRSGFAFNFATQRFSQNVTLTNIIGSAISGPISLVVDGLSKNATLFNSAGATTCASPLGSPYVNSSAAGLNPGASTTINLQFTDPTKAAITYTPRVLAGTAIK